MDKTQKNSISSDDFQIKDSNGNIILNYILDPEILKNRFDRNDYTIKLYSSNYIILKYIFETSDIKTQNKLVIFLTELNYIIKTLSNNLERQNNNANKMESKIKNHKNRINKLLKEKNYLNEIIENLSKDVQNKNQFKKKYDELCKKYEKIQNNFARLINVLENNNTIAYHHFKKIYLKYKGEEYVNDPKYLIKVFYDNKTFEIDNYSAWAYLMDINKSISIIVQKLCELVE